MVSLVPVELVDPVGSCVNFVGLFLGEAGELVRRKGISTTGCTLDPALDTDLVLKGLVGVSIGEGCRLACDTCRCGSDGTDVGADSSWMGSVSIPSSSGNTGLHGVAAKAEAAAFACGAISWTIAS